MCQQCHTVPCVMDAAESAWIHSEGPDWDIWAHPQGTEWRGWFQMFLFSDDRTTDDQPNMWHYDALVLD